MATRLESAYRRDLIDRIQQRWPRCFILPTDPQRRQGICDIVILFDRCWAMLEIKRESNARRRPNQDYYVEQFNGMSFAAFIYPENEDEVLDDLQSTLGV